MPRFTVQIVESRDIVYHIEADTQAEAEEIAMERETDEAVRDSYRAREHDWTIEGFI